MLVSWLGTIITELGHSLNTQFMLQQPPKNRDNYCTSAVSSPGIVVVDCLSQWPQELCRRYCSWWLGLRCGTGQGIGTRWSDAHTCWLVGSLGTVIVYKKQTKKWLSKSDVLSHSLDKTIQCNSLYDDYEDVRYYFVPDYIRFFVNLFYREEKWLQTEQRVRISRSC